MERVIVTPRRHWNQKVESLGLSWHSTGEAYWRENATYVFTPEEIDTIEAATNELYRIARLTVAHVIDERRFAELGIPESAVPLITRSWLREERSLYGRFDLVFNGREEPKLLEFNADTPTSLLEASIVQWQWKQDVNPSADQFNSLHERLVARWQEIVPSDRMLHLACYTENDEDLHTVEYLADTAIEAGLCTKVLDISQVCWSERDSAFFDLEGRPIQYLFKLYPWEWIMQDEFAAHLSLSDTVLLEPAWKMVLSNKGILPIMWELFPDHPNLLRCFRDPRALQGQEYVEKPIFSREGNNITIVSNGQAIEATGGYYAENPKVYQARATLPNFGGTNMIIGSWIIGDEAGGMGIREDQALITTNLSPFVPHYFR
jgi:glutathionylspermidine synthase